MLDSPRSAAEWLRRIERYNAKRPLYGKVPVNQYAYLTGLAAAECVPPGKPGL